MIKINANINFKFHSNNNAIISEANSYIILYPIDKGIYENVKYLFFTNLYLIEKTIRELFFNLDINILIEKMYNYKHKRDVFLGITITFNEEKEYHRFIRKNKIQNFLNIEE